MNDTAATPAPEAHDPPAGAPSPRPLSDDEVLIARRPVLAADAKVTVEQRRRITASDRYVTLFGRLGEDPMNLVRDMAEGRYRFKRRRDLTLWTDEHDQPVPERMSMRKAAAELERITGEAITYETLRRWWIQIWPGESPPDTQRAIPEAVFIAPDATP
jgi:hypothetical protein